MFNNRCVVEKLRISVPYRYGVVFDNEACFLYFKAGGSMVYSPTESLGIGVSEGVLMKCGSYFAEMIRNPGTEHCEVFAVHLHPDILRELYRDDIPGFVRPDGQHHFVQKFEKREILSGYIESLDFYFDNPSLVNDDLLRLKVKELILLLMQTKNAESILGLFSYLFTPRQANFREVVQTHLYSDFSLAELAKLSGRSLSAFKRDFETYFHSTPARYIKQKKLVKAKDLLLTTDFTIGEISDQVGFGDAAHFSKLFKKRYHLAPSEFRRQAHSVS